MNGPPPSSGAPKSTGVSVALCTCNGARFLAEQFESIARQTRPVDELILCDDASTDDTLAIADGFRDAIAGLTIVPNPSRLGVTKNFENAIRRCTGQIIFLCDQDDVWRADKVATLTGALDANPGAALAFSNAEVVREDGSAAGYRLWESIWFTRSEQAQMATGDALPVLLRHAVPAGCTVAFRSDLRPLLLPMPDLPHVHDVWIALLLACAGGRLVPVDEPLVSYRLHGGNTVGMRRYGLWDQLRMARHQLRSRAFAQLAQLHEAARDRLLGQTNWPISPRTAQLLEEKIHHSRIRDELAGRWSQRWGPMWSQWRAGNYQKYSYGLKSLLQDAFLR